MMIPYASKLKQSCALIATLGLLFCGSCHAERGGGDFNRGGYDHENNNSSNYNHDYNNNNYNGSGSRTWIVPNEGYVNPAYAGACSTVQQCDDDGNCVENQVCN